MCAVHTVEARASSEVLSRMAGKRTSEGRAMMTSEFNTSVRLQRHLCILGAFFPVGLSLMFTPLFLHPPHRPSSSSTHLFVKASGLPRHRSAAPSPHSASTCGPQCIVFLRPLTTSPSRSVRRMRREMRLLVRPHSRLLLSCPHPPSLVRSSLYLPSPRSFDPAQGTIFFF
jgi:hypothetical protein